MAVGTLQLRHPARVTRRPGLTPARVVARRMSRSALIWGAVAGFTTWAQVVNFTKDYPTPAAIAELVKTHAANIGIRVIFGPSLHVDTVGGYVATHAVPTVALVGAVWGLLTGTRLLRGEEEAGRWELLLAGPTTRRRAAASALAGLGIGLVTLWAVTAAITVAVGGSGGARFSVMASLFAATTMAAGAAIFLAVGALCSQLATTRRGAAAIAAGVFGTAFLLRVVAYSSSTLGWLHWATPLGWIDELQPLTGSSRPLVLIPITATIALLAAATIALAGNRDLAAGVLPARDIRPAHTRLLTSPLGLACRLQGGTALGWAAGLSIGGFLLGIITKGTADVWRQSGGFTARLTAATGGKAYLAMVFLIVAFIVALAAAAQVRATREEEAEGYLDNLLGRPVARRQWLTGRVTVSAGVLIVLALVAGLSIWIGAAVSGAGQGFGSLIAAGLDAVPAAIFVLGIGTLAHGITPRLAGPITYAVVAWSFLIEMIGASLGLSHWLLDTSILHHTARAPAAPVQWDMAAILIALGIGAAIAGALAFARRDLKGA